MPAIAIHHTETDTESVWDGPAEVAACPNEAGPLRHMHAWRDADGEPDAKQSYKFPHHKAGDDTPANINGVNNALARLSQADIPEGDRAGVEAHLRAHREDAGLEDEASIDDNIPARRNARHEPIRCFEGNARPHEPFWTWRNTLDGAPSNGGSEPEMELYGYISEYSWFEDDVTPKMFKDDLWKFGGGGPITIRLNSYGGDIIAASVMKAIIIDYPGYVTMKIDGLAASAATIVAIAGDVVRIQESAFFMIHDPLVAFFFAILDIEEMSRLLESLKSAKAGIIDGYETKTGLSRLRLDRMMADETWMTGREAVNMGFADEVITAEDKATKKAKGAAMQNMAAMQNAALINALHNYRNVPAKLLALRKPDEDEPDIRNRRATEVLRAKTKF